MIKKLCLLLCFAMPLANAASVVIVHPSNNSEISGKDIKKIFLGKKGAFESGQEAVPVTLKEGDATRTSFNESLLRKSDDKYIAYWSKMLFTGNGVPPKELGSMEEMKAFVAGNPSAIGFIDESMADGSVKVVQSF